MLRPICPSDASNIEQRFFFIDLCLCVFLSITEGSEVHAEAGAMWERIKLNRGAGYSCTSKYGSFSQLVKSSPDLLEVFIECMMILIIHSELALVRKIQKVDTGLCINPINDLTLTW